MTLTVAEGDTQQLRGWTVESSLQAALLPAVIYSVQNILLQLAYRNVDGLTFNLVNQVCVDALRRWCVFH